MFRRFRQAFFCFALLLLSVAAPSVYGADAETRVFTSAEKLFQDKFFQNAEKEFADFVGKFPASPRVAQALLRQAQAAREQKKFQTALNILTTNMASAAGIADQFQFQIARTYDESGRFAEAADGFGLLVSKYTNSSLRLGAVLSEAKARFNLGQWSRVADLLQNPGGVFQPATVLSPENSIIVDGQLLLAEALLAQHNHEAAEAVLASVPLTALSGELKWRCEYLRAKAQFVGQKLEVALATSSNAVAAGSTAHQPALESAAIALQGQILEALNRPEAAIAVYQQNQRPEMPPERVREALFKSVELTIEQGQLTNAVARLTNFLALYPNERASDIVLLTVAELRLKEHQLLQNDTNRTATNSLVSGTNLLAEAIENSGKLLRTFTNSVFAGQAHLVRGWALLEQGNVAESLAAFRSAADTLPWSEVQAVARFKVAELAFRSGEFTNALRDYRRVLGEYASLRRVQSELVPRARYQMVQAALAARDLAAAEEAMTPILAEFPQNDYTERTLLLYGQAVDELGDPAAARRIFSKFVQQSPNSPLRPKAELAVARTYERERDWTKAIAKYDAWVSTFPSNDNVTLAEYYRALVNSQAGRETNAFILFTNFVARFSTSSLAAHAEDWVGNFYFLREQFADAERNYQRVFQNRNWEVNDLLDLRYQARLKAGRAALMRGSFNDAEFYFTNLIEKTESPEPIRVQAYFAYGDACRDPVSPLTNAMDRYSRALTIYRQIAQFHQNDPSVTRAWGEMANCYFQLGGEKATNYVSAIIYYSKVTNAPSADVDARVQALVGIGNVQRKQAKIEQDNGAPADASALLYKALSNYLKVIDDTYDEEAPDPIWIKEAALNAAEIAELRNEWDSALHVYQRVSEMLPPMRSSLEKKIANAREKAALGK
jgi:TolA-binding protein